MLGFDFVLSDRQELIPYVIAEQNEYLAGRFGASVTSVGFGGKYIFKYDDSFDFSLQIEYKKDQ